MNYTLSEGLQAGMNNPDCSVWVGLAVGNWLAIKNLIIILLLFMAFKAIDKLALTPLIDWLKKKLKSHEVKR